MTTKTLGLAVAVLAMAIGLAGCATPDARIKRSPEVFARLTTEQQALVKEGRVAIGFDEDAVMLSLGLPDRKWSRTDATGTREVWSYTTWEDDRGQPLYRGWYHLSPDFSPVYYLNYPARREREYFKVIFGTDGKVAVIEENSRG
jgi:outer membrane protein assembly factor BamE (lipoprotein component of BamABCDE complex)